MRPARHRRRAVLAVVALLAQLGALAVAPGTALAAHHTPTAADVAKARADVARRQGQVHAARIRLIQIQRQLAVLNLAAEVAVERYDEAEVRLATATAAEDAAKAKLAAAGVRLDGAQQQVNAFVSQSYMSGGGVSKLDALAAADGPASLLEKVAALDSISRRQSAAVGELTSAKTYRAMIERDAKLAMARRQAAAEAAATARDVAQAKVSAQQALLSEQKQRQAALNQLLLAAMSKAQRLAHERAVALARAAAAAAARRAAEAARARAAREAAARAAAVVAPGAPTVAAPAPSAASSAGPALGSGGASVAVAWAYQELGKPYVWAASGPETFDCSGLTQFVWAKAGVYLDHYTGSQWNEGTHVATSDLQPGDLVFFATNTSDPSTIHHVGIYVGGGMMINAPHTGDVVRLASAFETGYIGAVRP